MIFLLLQVKETNENLQEDEEDTIVDSAFQSHIIGKNSCLDTSRAEIFPSCDLLSNTVSSEDHILCLPLSGLCLIFSYVIPSIFLNVRSYHKISESEQNQWRKHRCLQRNAMQTDEEYLSI